MKKLYLSIVTTLITSISWAQFAGNDDPCSAIAFPTGGTCGEDITISSIGATTSSVPFPTVCTSTTHDEKAYNDIWYTATADASGDVRIEATVGPDDPVVALYTSSNGLCTGTFTMIGCDDDGGAGLDADINITTGLTPGQTVWIRVWAYAYGGVTTEEGEFIIRATSGGVPPVNDVCSSLSGASAYDMTLNTPLNGTNFCATIGGDDPNSGVANCMTLDNTVWYQYTPAASGSYLLDLYGLSCLGVNNDLQVLIFTGGCSGSRTRVVCNSSGSTSSTSFVATAGTPYYIIVDGLSGAMCDFTIEITDCSDAGTTAGPALTELCDGETTTGITTSGVVMHTDPNACLAWGLWVMTDPLNVYLGMSGIGNVPTGGFPNNDANFAGVYTEGTFPGSTGVSPTLYSFGDGVTYYVAPITAMDCSGGNVTLDLNCFDVGAPVQIYNNPEIVEGHAISCDVMGVSTQVTFALNGGGPEVDGSNYTVSNSGGSGVLSSTSVSVSESFVINGLLDGETAEITVVDAKGCSEVFSVGPIVLADWCVSCAEAGEANTVHLDDGGGTVESYSPHTVSNEYILCWNDQLVISQVGAIVLPPAPSSTFCDETATMGSPCGFTSTLCSGGFAYNIYNAAPTDPDIFADPGFTNYGFVDGTASYGYTLDNSGIIGSLLQDGIVLTNNTIWLVPSTVDAISDNDCDGNQSYILDVNGDGCVDQSVPIKITMLNPIAANPSNSCAGLSVQVKGGHSEFFPSNYSISVVSPVSGVTVTNTPVGHGETFEVEGLTNGDAYSIDISDANGCSINISGTYTYIEPVPSMSGLNSPYCRNDPADNITGSPLPVTVTTGSFTLDVDFDSFSEEFSWQLLANDGTVLDDGGYLSGLSYAAGLTTLSVNIPGLDPADGPFTLSVTDAFGDGLSFGAQPASVQLTNNISGQVVFYVDGNGYTTDISFGVGNFYNSSATFSGQGITDNGDGTAIFNPTVVGTYDITYLYDNGEGCTYEAVETITVNPLPVALNQNPNVCETVYGSSEGIVQLQDYNSNLTGGATGYTYSWYSDPAATISVSAVTNITVSDGDIYYAVVSSAQGCSVTVSADFNVLPLAGITLTPTHVKCNGNFDGSILASVSGGSTPYSYLWSTGATIQNITGLSAGVYTLSVTESSAGSCINTATVTITQPTILTASTTPTDALCVSASDGSATASASGGTTNYSYLWSNGTMGAILSNVPAATYTVTVTDANLCSVTTSAVIGEPATSLSVATTVTDVSCFGGNNGSMIASASGGTTTYNYNWSPGSITNTQAGMIAGTYSLTVTDGGSCEVIRSLTITQPATALSISVSTVTPVSCNGGADGQGTVVGSGGTVGTGYSYLWPSGQTTTVGTGLNVAGSPYVVTVTDVNGCTATTNVTITQPAVLGITVTGTNVSCNGGANGTASVSVGGGSVPYGYLWSTGATTSNINSLPALNYTVTVTDSKSCTNSGSYSVTQPSALTLTMSGVDPDCNNSTDGSVSVVVSGGTSSYNYIWNDASFQTAATATGLGDGTYSVTVTDNNGCKSNNSQIITEPSALTLTALFDNPLCSGTSDGTATASGSGGTGALGYVWSSGGTSALETGLAAGNYTVTLTDGNGCTTTTGVTLVDPSAITATATSTSVTCNGGSNGTVTASAIGGEGTYTYLWSTGSTLITVTGLVATTYTVTVTDGNLCVTTTLATVNSPTAVSVSTSGVSVTCNGGNNGSATAVGAGGAGGFGYVWSSGVSTATTGTLIANSYTVTATDINACSVTNTFVVLEPTIVSVTTSGNDASCNGLADGDATATGAGGISTYTYQWGGAAGFQTTATATGLADGTYTVTTTDANGCQATTAHVISEPSALTLTMGKTDATCGAPDGTASVTVTGGTGPYSYLWNTTETTDQIIGLSAASYTVTVEDALTCTSSNNVGVNNATAPLITVTSVTSVTCNGGNDGSITAIVSGGNPAYDWSWSNLVTTTGVTTFTLTGLTQGNYSLTITDQTPCLAITSALINEPSALNSSIISSVAPSCNGSSNGTATVSVAGGISTNYSFVWSSGSVVTQATGLFGGITYDVTATDANGCTITDNVILSEPSALTLTAVATSVTCNGAANGEVDLTVIGGTTNYTYIWSNGPGTEDIDNLAAATYFVTVTDNSVCVSITSATITEPSALTVTMGKTDASCGGADGSAGVTVTGGTGPYSYLWNTTETTDQIAGLSAATYTVTATDNLTCTASNSVAVNNTAAPSITISNNTSVTCNGASTGSITAEVSGGLTPYLYTWSEGTTASGVTTHSIAGLAAGTYGLTISDNQGTPCLASDVVVVNQATALNATIISSNDPSCNGGTDGTLQVGVSGGTTNYSYNWNSGSATSTQTGLGAGVERVTISDANLCTITVSSTLSEPNPITFATTVTDAICNGNLNGAINMEVSGGTTSYLYNWSNGSGTKDISNLGAATYIVTITDAALCTTVTNITVGEPLTLSAVTNICQPVSTSGGSDGASSVDVSGGTTNYTYTWSNGATATGVTTHSITGLTVGTYTVTVVDGNACEATTSCNVNDVLCNVSVSTTITNIDCNGDADGQIISELAGSSGTAFTYSWSASTGNQTTQTATGLAGGNHSVLITDDLACSASATVSVTEPLALLALTTVTDISCNGGSDGKIDIEVSGGTINYSYLWNVPQTTEDISGLTSGLHRLTITDGNLCQVTVSEIVGSPTVMAVNFTPTDVTCFGMSDGSINVEVSGGTTIYLYNWSTGSTVQDVSGLAAGQYLLTVTDNNLCNANITATIGEPVASLTASITSTDITCAGASNGTVSTTVTGGNTPYQYTWINGETTSGVTNYSGGFNTVTITDAKSCVLLENYNIDEPAALGAIPTCNAVSVSGGSDGSSSVSVSGGTTAYSYVWSKGSSTTNSVTGVTSGAISVTITDANNCTITSGCVIADPGCSLSVSTTVTDILCNGNLTGEIIAEASGGLSPYQYIWSNGMTTGATISGIASNNYDLTITDASSCILLELGIGVNEPAFALNVAMTSCTDPSVKGASDGYSEVTVSGGTMGTGYSYTWSTNNSTNSISGLIGGTYDVTVTDGNGCAEYNSCNLTDPGCSVTFNVTSTPTSCGGTSDAEATVYPAGGLTPYSFIWSNGETTQTATGLSASDQSVLVSDAATCSASALYTITEPSAITVSTTTTDASCTGATNGDAQVFANGGNGGYTYLWDNGQITAIATGLNVGNYVVTVNDANFCNVTTSANVGQPVSSLTVSLVAMQTENCGSADGAITVTGVGGTTGYGYQWSTGGSLNQLSNLIAGIYDITVTDANNCKVSQSFNVASSANFSVTTTSVDILCNGESSGSITVSPIGGTSPYTYFWITSSTTESITGLSAGSYSFIATDASGCNFAATVPINQPSKLILNPSVVAVGCFGGADGSATVNVVGGVTNYAYSWFNGETNNSISGITEGTYSNAVTVTDGNGCKEMTNVTVSEPSVLQVFVSNNDVTCRGGSDGTAKANVFNGTPNYNYSWSNGLTTDQITGLVAGAYTVTVTDNNGCTAIGDGDVDEPTGTFNFNSTVTETTCYGSTDGGLILKAIGNSTPYSYVWNTVVGASTTAMSGSVFLLTLTDIPADTYIITITDGGGCEEVQSFDVIEPLLLEIEPETQNAKCGLDNGEAWIGVKGGNTASYYSFEWSNGVTTDIISGMYAGIYYVTVSDYKGCADSTYVIINNPNPFVVKTETDMVSCNGGSDGAISVEVSGGLTPYSFDWLPSTINNSDSTVSGLTAGVFLISIMDGNGCFIGRGFDVQEPVELLVSITETQYISCFGLSDGELNVFASGGNIASPYNYLWNFNNNTTTIVAGLSTNLYIVTVTDYKMCTGLASYTLTEPDLLSLTDASQSINCSGAMSGVASVGVSGGTDPYNYQWDNSANNSTANPVSGMFGGNYTVTVVDNHNCVETKTITVVEIPALAIISNTVDEICDGNDGSIILAVSGGTTAYTYNWSLPVVSATSSAMGIKQGVYAVTVTDANNCTITENITVSGTSIPNTPIAGPSQEVCFGEAIITLGAIPSNPSISWYDNDQLLNPLGFGAIYKPDTTIGVHTYYVTDTQQGCVSASASVVVTVKALPVSGVIGADTIVCYNDSINVFMDDQGGQIYWYSDVLGTNLIDSGEVFSDSIIKWGTIKTYYYEIVIDGCKSLTDSFNIVIGDSTIASFTATPEIGTVDLDVEFTNTSIGVDENFDFVQWYFGTGDESNEFNPMYTYSDAGRYEVMLIVEDYITGCIDTANVRTIVTDEAASFDVPIVFTPNGDGTNDVFKVNGNNLTSVDAKIYNRWGEMIYQWTLPEEVWDGRTFSGQQAPEGTYFFIISAEGVDKDGNAVSFGTDGPVSGAVTLMR